MLATAVTLALFAIILATVTDMFRHDARKIIAALEGGRGLPNPATAVQ